MWKCMELWLDKLICSIILLLKKIFLKNFSGYSAPSCRTVSDIQHKHESWFIDIYLQIYVVWTTPILLKPDLRRFASAARHTIASDTRSHTYLVAFLYPV